MKKALLVFLLQLTFSPATDYLNPRSTPSNELKYNPYQNSWSYERPRSDIKYNPFDNDWQYGKKDGNLQYNPFSNRWEIEK